MSCKSNGIPKLINLTKNGKTILIFISKITVLLLQYSSSVFFTTQKSRSVSIRCFLLSLHLCFIIGRNKALIAKLLRQGYRYFKLRKALSKFFSRHSALVKKYSVSLKTLLQQGISEPEFHGDLEKNVGKSKFSEQFRKLINRYKRIGYSLDVTRQTARLVVNPIIVDGYASLFNCTTAVRASDSMTGLS